ncbi:hypothetical protein GWK47_029086 [Chionoecetes opilio]|uniref:Uncharacterized protein n=1 Tax=Chionoecetes opilio TaxID=41210 RepID=A0A8J5CRQ0_CHIOP|nr:hypothetical protein GWK47_029086 [Chionoecetes opilio]
MDDFWRAPCFPHYLQDGSENLATGAAGAAFVSGQTKKKGLTDGASCLQAGTSRPSWRLHTPGSHSHHVIIPPQLKIPTQTPGHTAQDSIHPLTPLFFGPQRRAETGLPKIPPKLGFPQPVGLRGNEAGDRAAKSAAPFPAPPGLFCPGLPKFIKIKSASHPLVPPPNTKAPVPNHHPLPPGKRCNSLPPISPKGPTIPPQGRDRLNRLRLGFPGF